MSIRVNLLPHREVRRERARQTFYVLTLLSLLVGVGMILLGWVVLQGQISRQQARNEFIQAENRKLDAEIKEIATLKEDIEALRARQTAVEDLQADRNQPVHLLDELVRQIPEGVFLRSLKQEDRKVTVSGFAASQERVAELLRNLSTHASWIEKPELIEIKVAGQSPAGVARRVLEFSLSFTLKLTPERAELQQDAGPRGKPQPAKKP